MITVIGSLNYDLVTTAERVPNGGETVHATNFETHNGGKGANSALALGKLSPQGTQVAMVGLVGKDEFGEQLKKGLSDVGVDVKTVQTIDKVRTGVATILVETSGENRILVYSGANGELTFDKIPESILQHSKYILLQNEIPIETSLKVLEVAHEMSVCTVYNPSPIYDIDRKYYQYVDYLAVNETEARIIAKTPEIESTEDAYKAIDKLLELGVKKAVIVTLGAKGAVFSSADKSDRGFCPSTNVGKVVDTTGAGDTFLAATITKLALGESLKSCLDFASKASGIVVTRHGAASSIPTLEEVEKLK